MDAGGEVRNGSHGFMALLAGADLNVLARSYGGPQLITTDQALGDKGASTVVRPAWVRQSHPPFPLHYCTPWPPLPAALTCSCSFRAPLMASLMPTCSSQSSKVADTSREPEEGRPGGIREGGGGEW